MSSIRCALRYTAIAILFLAAGGCLTGGGGGQSGPDTEPSPTGLQVTIMSPDAAAIDTTDDQMSLSGIAGSEVGVSAVSWKSDKGAQGAASGTESWDIESIPLELGANTITVMATNVAGETRADTIVIRRETEGKGSVTLSWIAPTQRTDNSPLSNLAGHRISYGRMSGIHDYEVDIPNPGIGTYVVEGLVPGDWYFSLTAYDASGLESALSNEVRFTVR